ncbi:acyltransferase [Mangrovicoccus sp. HB182678]|uniref:Acyltransferase n=1 Tax=Mangrovicoccus algicola TaxID=2771008 RepID=A0A8J6YXH3_9RHOB|nr:acyltransferase [Mangrovicoccus algicola]
MHYRADIDGLRTLAVIPVFLFHAGPGLPGGYVGVDVFFVISGVLITTILWEDMKAGTYSIVTFYERRIRRIFDMRRRDFADDALSLLAAEAG